MAADHTPGGSRRSLVSRLRETLPGTGDDRPHLVVCGADALVYTLAEELAAGHRVRLTVIVPTKLRRDVPDLTALRGVRVIRADRLDERAFRSAGLAGATALALVNPDDVVNLHAALCAQAVEPDLRLVIRMFNTGLGSGVRRLFADCEVLSDAAMAAPAFVAASLGEVVPTHVRLPGRTVHVARREDVRPDRVVCTLTASGNVLPEEEPAAPEPGDLVLAEASGKSLEPAKRRRRPHVAVGRALRAALSRKLGIAVLVTLVITAVSGTVLALSLDYHGFWKSLYVTLLTVVGSSDVEENRAGLAQAAQLVLTIAGLALLPLITAAVVEGMVNARLALAGGRFTGRRENHVVLVGLGNVGTRVLRQLDDLGIDVVAVDRSREARGVRVAEQLGVPLIIGDAAAEGTLRQASIATSQALVVVSTDDVSNLQAALNAQEARPDLRVVLRLFDDDFARRVQTAFNIGISRSVSRLVAPAFAAAMLERDVIATIPVDRHALLLARVRVLAGSPLDGAALSQASRAANVRVIGLAVAGQDWIDWAPDPRRVLTVGDRVLVVARRAGLRALVEQAEPVVVEEEIS
ncbi:TrkA family potassium uptake protein [Actinoplanes sp. N902-109]|uniref:potassium channel family protein n=1 Tax=Actinoplanes sp. (strain N902-109) TaxID=649831 RepID=UPI0003293749|nr:NAD-binding protein [Actinoplanes sp. N902-109]AGL21326.1 TrkA-N domain-containing protein [Actinoplanes sp. N902-109]